MAKNWPLVKQGAQSVTVRVVQYLLRHRGHDLAVDGAFGPVTELRVKQFQQDEGLVADGKVGNATWPRLIVQVSQGATGDPVRAAQEHLRLRDLPETLGLAVDGSFGPLTDTATRAFQSWVNDHEDPANHLTVDGIIGPNTWWSLIAGLGPGLD